MIKYKRFFEISARGSRLVGTLGHEGYIELLSVVVIYLHPMISLKVAIDLMFDSLKC